MVTLYKLNEKTNEYEKQEDFNSNGSVIRLDLEINTDTNNLHLINKNGEQLGNGVELPTFTNEQVQSVLDKAIEDGKIGGALTSTAKNLLIAILESAVYTVNQSVNIEALKEELKKSASSGGGSTGGGDTPVTPNTYNITNSLTNCTSNNSATSIEENSSYTATLTASDGYEISSITVKMGGVDISSSVVNGSNINIDAVTGDIEIICAAKESFNLSKYLKASDYEVSAKSVQYNTMRFQAGTRKSIYSIPVNQGTYIINIVNSHSTKTGVPINTGNLGSINMDMFATSDSDVTTEEISNALKKPTLTATTSVEVGSAVKQSDGTYLFPVTVVFSASGYMIISTTTDGILSVEEVA